MNKSIKLKNILLYSVISFMVIDLGISYLKPYCAEYVNGISKNGN